jgi:hypothetical protein
MARRRPAGPVATFVTAVLLAACSGPAARPAPTGDPGPVTGTVTSVPTLAGAFAAAEAPSPVATTAPPPTTSVATPWCRSADLAVRYLGGDTTTLDPALDTILRYRLTNRSSVVCRAGAWVGVTMLGVAGCPAAAVPAGTGSAPASVSVSVTTVPDDCPADRSAERGRAVRATAWPAHDQVLQPGGSTVLSLLFADTYAPQSCPAAWPPPARLELRPAGDPRPLVVEAKVYPCRGELTVAPLGFGL